MIITREEQINAIEEYDKDGTKTVAELASFIKGMNATFKLIEKKQIAEMEVKEHHELNAKHYNKN